MSGPQGGSQITEHTPHLRYVLIYATTLVVGILLGAVASALLRPEWTQEAWRHESQQVDPRLAAIATGPVQRIDAFAVEQQQEASRRREAERRRAPSGSATDMMVEQLKAVGSGGAATDLWRIVRERVAFNVGLLVLRGLYAAIIIVALVPLYVAMWEAGRARALSRIQGGVVAVGRESKFRWAEVTYGIAALGALLVLPLPMAPATISLPILLIVFALVVYRYRSALGARV